MATPPLPDGLRVGIVTLWDGEPSFACAIMHWCDHALRLAQVFGQYLKATADLSIILTTNKGDGVLASDCPRMTVLRPDAALKAAVSRFSKIGCKESWAGGLQNMYKWLVFSLVQYQLLVYADLDVELLRPEQPLEVVGARWRNTFHIAAPPNREPHFLSTNDMESPLNGGLWSLAWPSTRLYDLGLGAMHSVRWNETDGFDGIGQPRDLYRNRSKLHWRMGSTRMLRSNTWHFSMGDCDQAFLFHMLYLKTAVGADFEPVESTSRQVGGPVSIGSMQHGKHLPAFVHTARHYYSHPKPWYWTKCQQQAHRNFVEGQYERCPVLPERRGEYLKNAGRVLWFLSHTDWRSRPLASSTCAAAFAKVLPELTKYGRQPPTKPPKYSGSLQRLR